MKLQDKWYNSEGFYHGDSVLIQCRQYIDDFFKTGLYTDLMEISWKYLSDASDIKSESEEFKKEIRLIADMDDALELAMHPDFHSIHFAVIVFNKSKHLYWYTKSRKEFMKRLNEELRNFD